MNSRPILLARFPDVRVEQHELTRKPESRGRLIDQVWSFRLLVAAALLVVAVATVPFLGNRGGQSRDQVSGANSLPEWNPAEPVLKEQTVVSPEYEVGAAEKEAGVAEMSVWPNPDHPIEPRPEPSVVPHEQISVNRAMAIRPTEHLKDTDEHPRPSIH